MKHHRLSRRFTLMSFAVCMFVLLISWWYVTVVSRMQLAAIDRDMPPVVYLLPHQDDEMFFAGSLYRNVKAGKRVYVAIVTDGGLSAVRERFHMNRQALAAARNRELLNSVVELGLPPSQLFFLNPGGVDATTTPRYPDGGLTVALASEAIAQVYQVVGDGVYVTVAGQVENGMNAHADHQTLHMALVQFPGITYKQFFSEQPRVGTRVPLTPDEHRHKQVSLEQYSVWRPSAGRYAIGWHSVRSLLRYWSSHDAEYLVLGAGYPHHRIDKSN